MKNEKLNKLIDEFIKTGEEFLALANYPEPKSSGLHIPVVTTRTWLFSGWYAGDRFETKVTAEDRETAIAHFETDFPNHRWHMTQEIV